ncbi:MAG: Uma2 family endonuclease [Acidobacteriota bacterium]|nr:Uma2 family endonuclease [Acidobacteriota bacterium]
MSQPLIDVKPDISHLITEDDTPVDNLPSEKHQRLLTEPLYSSWSGPGEGRPFLVAANVGIFYMVRSPAIVPDVFLSVDVEVAPDWWQKEHRSYFLWEFGKSPDVVIEIVSNTEGGEDDEKKRKYERMRVQYYVIYDPLRQVMKEPLTVYQLRGYSYVLQPEPRFPELKLGLTLWEGEYEGKHDTWLRWTDEHGQIIPTGKERAERERMEKEAALRQLEQERQRAARLAERLRQLGHDPDQE